MANNPLSMLQIRRILQLLSDGRSCRQIHRECGVHRNTVKGYVARFEQTGKSYAELGALLDSELSAVVYAPRSSLTTDERLQYLETKFEHYRQQLKRTGVTKLLLWEEYLQEQPGGYRYAQFSLHLKNYLAAQPQATMPQSHAPGERLEIDFAGKLLQYFDRASNELINCPVVVCTLPFSSMSYVEPLASSRQEHLIPALNRALEYFGGIPKIILSDNMAQVVVRSCRYEPVFTQLIEQWALHYHTTMKATRVSHPKDKPSVEKTVHLSYQQIYARQRNETATSLSALKYRTHQLLEEFNDRLMSQYGLSRRQRFEQEEKASLQALPDTSFQLKHEAMATVKKSYHVILGEDWHQYSIPYQYIGKRVKLIYDESVVEVFLDFQRIALHQRSTLRNGYTTKPEHMPEAHRRYRLHQGWSPDDFIWKAAAIGAHTENVMQRMLASRSFIEQTYDACLGVLRLKERYGADRLEAACGIALPHPTVGYRMLKNMLENNRDKLPAFEPDKLLRLPTHDNIRGREAYH